MEIDKSTILARGEWKYGGVTPCSVIIQAETRWPGTGDYEDSPEVADDREMPCVSVWYESLENKEKFNAGGGYFLTVEEAIEAVTKRLQGSVKSANRATSKVKDKAWLGHFLNAVASR